MNISLRKYVESVARATVVVLLTALVGCGGMLLFPGPTGDRPQVQGVYPAVGATGVPLNVTVQATFDSPMDPSTINASTFTLSALGAGAAVSPSIKSVEGTVTYVAATRTAVLTPAADLDGFTFYDATVSGDVQDTSGNTMGADYTWRFRTSDLIAPDVAETFPEDGATDVEEVPAVTVTFTEDVNEDTVDGNSFRVNKGAEQVAGSVGASGDLASFTPDDDLECSETYTGLVTTAIEDLSGIGLASNYAWTWTMAPGRWMHFYDAVAATDDIRSIAETTDGGYIVAGTTNNVIGAFQSAWIMKLDANGEPEWQKTFGDATDDDSFESVQQTADGGYVAAGGTHLGGLGGLNYWVMKFSADGNRQWETIYGGAGEDTAYEIQELAAGGYVVAGRSNSFTPTLDVYVTTLNAAGTVQSTVTIGTAVNDFAYSIQQTGDGGFIVAGSTSNDVWVIKLNSILNVNWEITYDGGASDIGHSVRQTAEGGYIVLADTLSFAPPAGYNLWVLKIDKDGLLVPPGPDRWQFVYGGAGNDHDRSIRQTSDGGYIMSGVTQSFGLIREDGWLVKLDSTGAIEWENSYGNAGADDRINAVFERAGGGYVAGGRWEDPDLVGFDAWVLNLDLTGEIDASCTLIAPTAATRNPTAAVTGFTGTSSVVHIALVGVAASTEVDTSANEETQCRSPCAPLTP